MSRADSAHPPPSVPTNVLGPTVTVVVGGHRDTVHVNSLSEHSICFKRKLKEAPGQDIVLATAEVDPSTWDSFAKFIYSKRVELPAKFQLRKGGYVAHRESVRQAHTALPSRSFIDKVYLHTYSGASLRKLMCDMIIRESSKEYVKRDSPKEAGLSMFYHEMLIAYHSSDGIVKSGPKPYNATGIKNYFRTVDKKGKIVADGKLAFIFGRKPFVPGEVNELSDSAYSESENDDHDDDEEEGELFVEQTKPARVRS